MAPMMVNMKSSTTFIIKNWKTSLTGVLVAILAILKIKDVIDIETLTIIITLLTSAGFLASKDADKSGV